MCVCVSVCDGVRAARAAVRARRPHGQGVRLQLEPVAALGRGQRRRGQHPADMADGTAAYVNIHTSAYSLCVDAGVVRRSAYVSVSVYVCV